MSIDLALLTMLLFHILSSPSIRQAVTEVEAATATSRSSLLKLLQKEDIE
jgi:hypothetical protein